MGNVILDESSLNDIGDAIRSKLGVETTYLPREMAAAIMSIDTKDVIEGYLYEGAFYSDSGHTQQLTGEAGKLYIDIPTSGMYRWGGSQYVKVSGALTLGETEDTAYRGDRGKVAYDHAQLRGSQFSSALYKIGTNSEGHVTSATPVEKSDITALGIPSQDSTYTPSSSAPQMNGTASAGTSVKYSRGDHVHPTDTSRMAADLKGAANGVAELDASGKVPSSQLPSYVDDVLEYAALSDFPATGETGKIYVATTTNETYRWSGSAYVSISNPLDYATQAEAEAGTENTHVMTPLRVKQAIAANVSEYTLPPMSPTTRGGAKLGSGLAMDGDVLSVSLESESDGTDAGPIVELTAQGWATQDGTPSPDYPQEIQTVTGHEVTGKTGRFVDIDVYDGSTHVATIPVPLPSRGWVGALPDGTADVLTLDGAGKVVWELADKEITFNGSEGISNNSENRIGYTVPDALILSNHNEDSNVLCTHFASTSPADTYRGNLGVSLNNSSGSIFFSDGTKAMTAESWTAWLSTHPVTVLYPLATPVTEDMGYVDLPEIPEGASLSIPELDGLNVKYRLSLPTVLAGYEDRITALEEAVAELVAGA